MQSPWFGSVYVLSGHTRGSEVKEALHLGLEHWSQISTDLQLLTECSEVFLEFLQEDKTTLTLGMQPSEFICYFECVSSLGIKQLYELRPKRLPLTKLPLAHPSSLFNSAQPLFPVSPHSFKIILFTLYCLKIWAGEITRKMQLRLQHEDRELSSLVRNTSTIPPDWLLYWSYLYSLASKVMVFKWLYTDLQVPWNISVAI